MKKILLYFLFSLSILSCTKQYEETIVPFDDYQIEEGFELQAIVAEPLLEAPVNISFDDQGRLWAIEMAGYMQTIEGLNPKGPIGRILLFEDKDDDGQMDHTTIFLDSLKLVRAIAHVYGGLLYAEPPNLYFTEINKDLTPGTKILVDSSYAVGGNVEHQPNGLLMNVDNWIYNAKSTKRYRLKDGEWQIETTSFRGQWGITHDAMGRLLYNDNSNQVRGDWVLPNVLNQNPNFKSQQAININIVKDQRVYPIQATAVNRGYVEGNLDEEGKLKKFTSSCGPVFFEGHAFPDSYQGNVFVCGPEVNLIKRNKVDQYKLRRAGEQVWEGKEFIISKDEAFRPVNLQNGPDGALYIVDMHRGIIQHKTYMTSYLRDLYIKKGLDSIVGMGRILRVSGDEQSSFKQIDLTEMSQERLIDSLGSSNIWIRNKAQQLLINSGNLKLEKALKKLLEANDNEITKIHALYTLEGLGIIDKTTFNTDKLLNFPALCAHVLKLLASHNLPLSSSEIERLMTSKNETIDYYLAFYLSKQLNNANNHFLKQLIERYDEAEWFLEPVYAGAFKTKNDFISMIDGHHNIKNKLNTFKITKKRKTPNLLGKDGLTKGLVLYRNNCASCHGPDGEGLTDLAPPLLASEFVSGNPEKLAAIMVYGLTGAIEVNGTSYEFSASMPGLGNSSELTSEDIKNIGNYIRNAFTTSPQNLRTNMVDSIKSIHRPLDKVYTVKELNETY